MFRGQLPAVGIDIANAPNVLDAAITAVGHVAVLQIAETAAESELAGVIQGLATKQKHRVLLQRAFDGREAGIVQGRRKVHVADFQPEIGM